MKRILTMLITLMFALSLASCTPAIVEQPEAIVTMPDDAHWGLALGFVNTNLYLNYEAYPDVEWTVSVENGQINPSSTFGGTEDLIASNGDTISWAPIIEYLPQEDGSIYSPANHESYVTLIARDEGHIVGYAVARFYSEDETLYFYGDILVAATFPQVDGKYQDVTDEYVTDRINAAKNPG